MKGGINVAKPKVRLESNYIRRRGGEVPGGSLIAGEGGFAIRGGRKKAYWLGRKETLLL